MKRNYEELLKSHLAKSSYMRHLFNKLGKIVRVVIENGEEIVGELRSIDVVWEAVEVYDIKENKTYFINFRRTRYIEYDENRERPVVDYKTIV
ncbi:hypothetical protein DRN69_05420 [Candidatus Pacearchaeota archaeon]|nr:MAG: hypothetical protein DRN69_05420 [Candidatus Pacearchaeota archaeon]